LDSSTKFPNGKGYRQAGNGDHAEPSEKPTWPIGRAGYSPHEGDNTQGGKAGKKKHENYRSSLAHYSYR
jgi:hypothetical protein